jgi:hypothetical protein
MPFQPGNTEGSKSRKAKPYRAALMLELAAAESGNPMPEVPPNSLRAIVRGHLVKAAEKDMAAIKELADRLDGKVPQIVAGDDEADPITLRTIVTGVPRKGDDE